MIKKRNKQNSLNANLKMTEVNLHIEMLIWLHISLWITFYNWKIFLLQAKKIISLCKSISTPTNNTDIIFLIFTNKFRFSSCNFVVKQNALVHAFYSFISKTHHFSRHPTGKTFPISLQHLQKGETSSSALVWLICLMAYQLLLAYLIPTFNSFDCYHEYNFNIS